MKGSVGTAHMSARVVEGDFLRIKRALADRNAFELVTLAQRGLLKGEDWRRYSAIMANDYQIFVD